MGGRSERNEYSTYMPSARKIPYGTNHSATYEAEKKKRDTSMNLNLVMPLTGMRTQPNTARFPFIVSTYTVLVQ